jgi:uncharacterized caspase-like protein
MGTVMRRVAAASAAAISTTVLLVHPATADTNERRVALVVGNGAYRDAPALENPLSDAKAMSAALKRIGFEVVEGYDLDLEGMRKVVGQYAGKIDGAKVAFVYYAGHGVAVAGENYFLPTDTVLRSEADLDFKAMNMSLVLRQMQREDRVNVVILDACRDNPFAKELARSMRTRSALVSSGLTEFAVSPAAGTMIAFATDPGKTALDGAAGQNSPFTSALLKHIESPGVSISTVMDRVRQDVWRSTNEKQRPWVNTSIIGEFYLNPAPASGMKVASVDAGIPVPATAPNGQSYEIKLWEAAERSGSIDDYKAYLEAHPNGYFAQIARNRIARAQAAPVSAAPAAPAARTADSSEPGTKETEAALDLSVKERAETQMRLKAMGFDPGSTSGAFGPATRRAITRWQQARQKPATGFLTKGQHVALWEESEVGYQKLIAARPAPAERKVRSARPQQQQRQPRVAGEPYPQPQPVGRVPVGRQPVGHVNQGPSMGEVGSFLGGVGGLVGSIRR